VSISHDFLGRSLKKLAKVSDSNPGRGRPGSIKIKFADAGETVPSNGVSACQPHLPSMGPGRPRSGFKPRGNVSISHDFLGRSLKIGRASCRSNPGRGRPGAIEIKFADAGETVPSNGVS